jgi:RNA polymerase sigma factor (sigma-70 family)
VPNGDEHHNLVERFRQGDPRAAEALFRRYAVRLARLAEEHLSRKLAGRVGGEDVIQFVFRTFFQRCARGEFHIDDSAQVWRLLVKLTLRRARAEARRHLAGKRDASAEAPGGDIRLAEALAHDPDPAEAAQLADQIEHLLKGLPPLHCHVLELRLQGHAVADIATQLAVSRQTVYRVLDLLQHRLTRSLGDELS